MAMTFMRVLIFDNPVRQPRPRGSGSSPPPTCSPPGRDSTSSRWAVAATGLHGQRTLIVGAGTVGRQFAERLIQRPEFGLRPVAFLDDDPIEIDGGAPLSIPILSSDIDENGDGRRFGAGLEAAIEEHSISHVVVSFSAMPHGAELDLVRRCQQMGLTVSVLPRLFEGVTDRLDLERVGGIPLLSVHPTDPGGWQYAVKYAGRPRARACRDRASVAGDGGRRHRHLDDPGQARHLQAARVGLDGREFDLLKFRTMR